MNWSDKNWAYMSEEEREEASWEYEYGESIRCAKCGAIVMDEAPATLCDTCAFQIETARLQQETRR